MGGDNDTPLDTEEKANDDPNPSTQPIGNSSTKVARKPSLPPAKPDGAKPVSPPAKPPVAPPTVPETKPGDWTCPKCGNTNPKPVLVYTNGKAKWPECTPDSCNGLYNKDSMPMSIYDAVFGGHGHDGINGEGASWARAKPSRRCSFDDMWDSDRRRLSSQHPAFTKLCEEL